MRSKGPNRAAMPRSAAWGRHGVPSVGDRRLAARYASRGGIGAARETCRSAEPGFGRLETRPYGVPRRAARRRPARARS